MSETTTLACGRGARRAVLLTALAAAMCLAPRTAPAQPYAGPQRLEAARAWLQMLERQGGFVEVPAGDTLEVGQSDPRVAVVCQRLRQSRDLRGGAPCGDPLYTEALAGAVRAFQQRHGLVVDGVLGPATLRELNVPVAKRLEQIESNIAVQNDFLDTWTALGERYVFVNVPDFRLMLMNGAREELEMRVIVGQQGWHTPVMHERMEYLVLNPEWDVPHSIVAREIAPAMTRDGRYLERNEMELLASGAPNAKRISPSAVDWAEVTEGNFRYHVRQRPGERNPLGQIKFMFPNAEAIYLHDTPHDHLFARDQRALSHGCIRVEHPIELAIALLGPDSGWDRARLEQVTAGNAPQRVDLAQPIPVHILYWTAFVDDDGLLHFRPDPWEVDPDTLRENAVVDAAFEEDEADEADEADQPGEADAPEDGAVVPAASEAPEASEPVRPWWERLPL